MIQSMELDRSLTATLRHLIASELKAFLRHLASFRVKSQRNTGSTYLLEGPHCKSQPRSIISSSTGDKHISLFAS